MDYTYVPCTGWFCDPEFGADPFVPNRFNVDLNDNLFTPGDTILYFFRASSLDGTTYFTDGVSVRPAACRKPRTMPWR